MSGLRLDYFLSLVFKLVDGDKYELDGDDYTVGDNVNLSAANENDLTCARCFITSFAPRKNTGEQPCGDDVPVVVTLNGGEVRAGIAGVTFSFSLNEHSIGELYRVKAWKPDLEALIKMQDEYDKKLAEPKPKRTIESTAVETLNKLGYSWNGGELWRPPLGKAPEYIKQKRTKTEYVKVEFGNAWEAVKAFEEGVELYWKTAFQNEYRKCKKTSECVFSDGVYRKVEREVTWQDELQEFMKKERFDGGYVKRVIIGSGEYSEVDISISFREQRFIAMCHLVASMTDNK